MFHKVMFNTIKSKIILIALLMLVTLSILFGGFSYLYMKHGKSMIIECVSYSITVFARDINKDIVRIEDNAKDLALHGELFYTIDKNKKIAEDTIIRLFENYKDSLGGGIWFEPYKLNKNVKLYCIYVYRNKLNKVVPDESFETEEYNYPQKSWYKEILPDLNETHNVAWSLPYYEKEGSNTLMVTAGSGIYYKGELVGLSTVDREISSIIKAVSEMKITPNSFALFADREQDYIIASTDPYIDNNAIVGKSIKTLPWYADNLKQITYFDYHGKKYIPYVKTLDNGMMLIVNVPKHELFMVLYKHVLSLFAALMVIGLIIAFLLYKGLKRYIDTPIQKLTDTANKISNGDLDIKIKIEKPEEFAKLADTFNKMSVDVKNITKERERIESELSLAKEIQSSSLPNVFPPFPDNKEFEIYAGMEPAKEVGGDFYDFYFTDEDNFMFSIADVSGKGIPAALFMMTVKTLISYIAKTKISPKEMIEMINKKICMDNKQGFFVTMLAGIINIKTGVLTLINCGHNPPIIKKENGECEYLKLQSNIVLGAFENAEFEVEEMQLSKGDTIILYTDGITEAVNSSGEFFEEQRLIETVRSLSEENITDLQNNIKKKVKEFTDHVPQSDDMTMLVFKYNGEEQKQMYENIASKENYHDYLNWLNKISSEYKFSQDLKYKMELISEEIYTNIFSYAYPEKEGKIEVTIEKTESGVNIEFSDYGIPFNPLDKEDPDVEFPPQEREQGGLGIFIVKNIAESVSYNYKNGKNILTIKL